MDSPVRFFDLLGVAGEIEPAQAAADRWPAARVKSVLDPNADLNPVGLMQYLQSVLEFRAVRPAASAARTGLTADVVVSHVIAGTPRPPLVLDQLPAIAFVLEDTGGAVPARLFVTKADTGIELVIEALPVEIRVPSDLLRPAYNPVDAPPLIPDSLQTAPFDRDVRDSLEVTLRDIGYSSIRVRVRVRMTEEGDVVIEPAVPISIGPCRFYLDLPCRGLHDLNFVPSPRLSSGHSEREQALEWARHPLDVTAAPGTGVLTVRTVDLDESAWPIAYFLEKANGFGPIENRVDLVLEDLALPLVADGGMIPIPSHGLAGLRRRVVQSTDPNEAFGFGGSAVDIELTKSIHLLVDQLLVQSPSAPDEQFAFVKLMLAFGASRETTLGEDITADATSARVADPSVFTKKPPFQIVIDPHTPREERPIVGSIQGDVLAGLDRGPQQEDFPGPFAQPHDAGAIVKGASWAFTLDVTDDWTVMLGARAPELRPFLEVFGSSVRLVGLKLGASIARLAAGDPSLGFADKVAFLVDLEIGSTPGEPPDPDERSFPIKFVDAAGEPIETVMRDVGWFLGSFTLGSDGVAFPEGVQLIWFDLFRLIVEDVSWVTETNGGQYLSLTGGLIGRPGSPIPASLDSPGSSPESVDSERDGLVIRVHRLRFRVAGGDGDGDSGTGPQAVMLDGVSLAGRWERFELSGYGMISEYTRDGSVYREWAVGVFMKFALESFQMAFGAEFLYGKVTGAVGDYSYLLAGLQFGPVPLCGLRLLTVRGLFALRMRPNLPPPDGTDGKQRIYAWYKQHAETGVSIPVDRDLAQSGWVPQDGALAIGIGVSIAPAVGRSARFEGFAFFYRSDEERGFLFVLEAYLFRSPDPVLFGGLEVDGGEGIVSAFLGGSIGLDVFFDRSSPLLAALGKLTGLAYLEIGLDKGSGGSRPWRFALGRLDDQSSWLTVSGGIDRPFTSTFLLALCFEMGNDPDEPNGIGVVGSMRSGWDFGVVRMQSYGTAGVLLQCWRNESESRSFALWVEVAGWVEVARILRMGMQFRIEWDRLGPGPTYQRIAFDLVLDLPWWMPDATLRFEYVEEQRRPEALAIISTPVVSAEAIAPGTQAQVDLVVVAPGGGSVLESGIFSLEDLDGLADPTLDDAVYDGLAPSSVDALVAIDFGASVDDRLSIGESTPPGAGTQRSNDLAVTYELVELEIRRRPRFGPGVGTWTTLLAPAETTIDSPDGQLSASFSSTVGVRWDRDVLRGDQLDPIRLLVNAAVPYTFATANPAADEATAHGERRWPCCTPSRHYYLWHELDFGDVPLGERARRVQSFTTSSSTLHWIGQRPPVVAAAQWAPGERAARLRFDGRDPGTFAVIGFDEPASIFEAQLYWPERATPGLFIVEAYAGLKLVDVRVYPLGEANPPPPVRIETPEGISSVRMRYVVDPKDDAPADARSGDRIEVFRMQYRTVREELDKMVFREKCRLRDEQGSAAAGRFAWLPNHDYEISVVTRIALDDDRAGARVVTARQRVGMRTKGLPGTNAVATTGDELASYVESVYPPSPGMPLYGVEPVVVAFDERFNILAPVGRTIVPDDPAERAQVLEWALTVDRLGAASAERLTSTSEDWIVAHRVGPAPSAAPGPRVVDATILRSAAREARSEVSLQIRYESMQARPSAGCGTPGPALHASHVLSHSPVSSTVGTDSSARWQPGARHLASVRRKNGPFVLREPFVDGDHQAFAFVREQGGAGPLWIVDGGSMRVVPTSTGRCYAVFGEQNWDHVRIVAAIDPEGGEAGIAVGVRVAGGVSDAMLVLIDEGARMLRIVERRVGAEHEISSVELPEQLRAPYALEVIAFDDSVRATVADISVEAPRTVVREGRLGLVTIGSCSVGRLSVEPIEAYRFEFVASRFATFEDHIASFRGVAATIPADAFGPGTSSSTVAALVAETAPDIETANVSGDASVRQRLFDRWTSTLSLPLRRRVEYLEVDRFVGANGTELFVIESPEPLGFTSDVTLTLRCGGIEVAVWVISDAARMRALVIPVSSSGTESAPIAAGDCELTFSLDRSRYRVEAPDTSSNYRATTTIVIPSI